MTAQLLAALIVVESGGNDMARGARGELGALQIRRSVVRDVNRIHGTAFRHREMTNRETAVRVCVLYVEHYAPGADPEIQARVWNGGPRGAGRISTVNYWQRVRREMK
jgi:hypothetical protein